MAATREIDDIDRAILALLCDDARRTVKDIAAQVGLSPAPVARRIERLERSGVIRGYTVRLGHVGPSLEAFTELRYAGHMNQDEMLEMLVSVPEVHAAYTTAGDCDAIAHLRADDIDHLQRVITKLRNQGQPISSRTLLVLKKLEGSRKA